MQHQARHPFFLGRLRTTLPGEQLKAAAGGFGIGRKDIILRACRPIKADAPQHSGKDWWAGFKARHPELSLRKPEALSTSRSWLMNQITISRYFSDVGDILARLNIIGTPERVWNADEVNKRLEHCPTIVVARNSLGLLKCSWTGNAPSAHHKRIDQKSTKRIQHCRGGARCCLDVPVQGMDGGCPRSRVVQERLPCQLWPTQAPTSASGQPLVPRSSGPKEEDIHIFTFVPPHDSAIVPFHDSAAILSLVPATITALPSAKVSSPQPDLEINAQDILKSLAAGGEDLSGDWNADMNTLFDLPPPPIKETKKKKGLTSHRLLTSDQIIEEKKQQLEERERKLKEKEERKRKRDEKKALKMKTAKVLSSCPPKSCNMSR